MILFFQLRDSWAQEIFPFPFKFINRKATVKEQRKMRIAA